MIITKTEQIKKQTVRVWINDEPAFRLTKAQLDEEHLAEGSVLDAERLAHLHTEVLLPAARQRCMDLLLAGDKTRKTLDDRLSAEDYPEDVVREALDWAQDYHYIDDLRFAENFIDRNRKLRSRREITMKLQQKGVPDEIIGRAFESEDPLDAGEQILAWAEKKHFDPGSADRREQERFYAFLARRGFSYGDIRRALEEHVEDDGAENFGHNF